MWDGWKGGDTPVVGVSAKTKDGIPELLDMVLLVTDVEELKADTDVPARGPIIEAHVETGRGPVNPRLGRGQPPEARPIYWAGSYAKVRNLESTSGGALQRGRSIHAGGWYRL